MRQKLEATQQSFIPERIIHRTPLKVCKQHFYFWPILFTNMDINAFFKMVTKQPDHDSHFFPFNMHANSLYPAQTAPHGFHSAVHLTFNESNDTKKNTSYSNPQNVYGKPLNGYFYSEDSEDPDEKPYNAAFHQSLHCLVR